MRTEIKLADYLAELRRQVCSYCVERPLGGPPCAPLGKQCGIELHLRELVEAVHEVRSGSIEPYLDNNREKICTHCPLLHSSTCPCPMDELAVLVVEAIEAVDEGDCAREVPCENAKRPSQARVTLTVQRGAQRGRQLVFDMPASCLIGRGTDCSVQLNSDWLSGLISRHHCLLDVDPPAVQLRDLGSCHGTFVNGQMIGQRPRFLTAEEAGNIPGPAYELGDGDEIQVGPVFFQVSVSSFGPDAP